jgi:hypothetical protein
LIFLLAFSAGELIVRRKKTFGVVSVLEAEKDELEVVASFLILTTKYINIESQFRRLERKLSTLPSLSFNLSFYIFTMPRFLCGKPLAH